MPPTKSDQVRLQQRNADIVQMALDGMPVDEIADEYALTSTRIRQILNEQMHEASIHMRDDAASLLAKNYARAEILLESLMDMALKGNDAGPIVLSAVDRVIKLLESQSRILGTANALIDPRDNDGRSKYDPDAITFKPEEYDHVLDLMHGDQEFELLGSGEDD